MTIDRTSVQLRPALDYFVARNISIGGQLRIEYASGDNGVDTTITTIGLVPRILEGVDTTKNTDIGLMSTIGGYFGP